MKRSAIVNLMLLIGLTVLLTDVYAITSPLKGPVTIYPKAQTGLCHSPGDETSDVCIWLHPLYLDQSLIIGNDRPGGIILWDLDGKEQQFYSSKYSVDSLDIRYGFPFGNQVIALIGSVSATGKCLTFYTVNPITKLLKKLNGEIKLEFENPQAGCLYHSPITGQFYFFVSWKNGWVQEWELSGENETITGKMVREFKVASQITSCLADDALTRLYIVEEDLAVWRYGAEPNDGKFRDLVDSTSPVSGHLIPDIVGITIYYASGPNDADPVGYLVVSSQGNNAFQIYDRINNAYLGGFQLGGTGTIDAVTSSKGGEVINLPLNESWSTGLFVAHDHASGDSAKRSNYKLIPWGAIAEPLSLKTATSSWDPRKSRNHKPKLADIPSKTVTVGQPIIFTVRAEDDDRNNIDFYALNLPNGAYFDPETHRFSWTPDFIQAGEYEVTFVVSDGYELQEEKAHLIVTDPPQTF